MRHALLVALMATACDDYVLPSDIVSTRDTSIVTDYSAILALPADATAGQDVFNKRCGPCHDPAGAQKKIGPALKPWVETQADEATLTVALEGLLPKMPPVNLTDQEAADMIAWLNQAFPKP